MVTSRNSPDSERDERRSKRREFSTVNLFEIFLRQGPALGWIKDAAGRYIFLNGHFHSHIKTCGFDLIGRSDCDWLPKDIVSRTKAHDDAVISTGNLMEFMESLPDPNGDYREWLVFKFPLQDEEGKMYVGCVAADVHERRVAERRLATQYSVTHAFAEAASLGDVTPKFLEALCSTFFWDLSALWITSSESGRLSCLGVWHQEELQVPQFLSTCTDAYTASDLGLPDRVLACQAPAYVNDIGTYTGNRRTHLAAAEGLRSGFGYPLRDGKEIFGVVEFYSKQPKDVVPELLLMLDALSSQLRQFIKRKQAEEKLAQSNAILKALSRAQSQFIVTGEIDSVFGLLLQDIIGITESKFGFIGSVKECKSGSPQIRLHAVSRARSRDPQKWDSNIEDNEEFAKQTLELESHTESNLINLILTGGKPIIYNRTTDKIVRANPADTLPLSASFLGLPVLFGQRLVGMVALANRASGYNEALADALKPFLSTCGIIIDAHYGNQLKDEALHALKGNENRLSTILTGAADGIITITDEGVIESVNPAAEKTFQHRSGELLGRKYSLLLPMLPGDIKIDAAGKPRKYLKRELLNGLHETKGRRNDDSFFPAEISVSEVKAKEETFYSLIVRDISERKEVERRLTEFCSTISHELRTPLTSIRGSLGLIEGGVLGDLSTEMKDFLSIARGNCDRLMELINDILDLRRIDANQMELKLAPVEPGTLVNESIDKVKPIAEAKRISLELDCQSKQLVEVDMARIVQALTNLLSNAVKFSPPGTLVKVKADDAQDKMVRFSVEDQADGIPAEQIKRLFEKFQQLDSSDTRANGGTGLGLAICKSLVELHGGRIDVDSKVGKGSTFWFDIPASNKPEGQTEQTGRTIES